MIYHWQTEVGDDFFLQRSVSGVNVWLDQTSFTFTMPDESLDGLDIHARDIAVVSRG